MMKIDLNDLTPLTVSEALIMVLDAKEHVENDLNQNIYAIGYATMELRAAEYRIRREAIEKKVGALP